MPINTCVLSDERHRAAFEDMVCKSDLCAAIPMLSDTGCLRFQGIWSLFVQWHRLFDSGPCQRPLPLINTIHSFRLRAGSLKVKCNHDTKSVDMDRMCEEVLGFRFIVIFLLLFVSDKTNTNTTYTDLFYDIIQVSIQKVKDYSGVRRIKGRDWRQICFRFCSPSMVNKCIYWHCSNVIVIQWWLTSQVSSEIASNSISNDDVCLFWWSDNITVLWLGSV